MPFAVISTTKILYLFRSRNQKADIGVEKGLDFRGECLHLYSDFDTLTLAVRKDVLSTLNWEDDLIFLYIFCGELQIKSFKNGSKGVNV